MSAFITPQRAGVAAAFILIDPNGLIASALSVTDDIGKAEAQFIIKRRAPRGEYKGRVTVQTVFDEATVLV
jgi:hypothetical protein